MKIAIFGTATVGRTLADKLKLSNHEIMIGTRDVKKTLAHDKANAMGEPPFKDWQKENSKIKLGTFEEAAQFGDVVFLAVRGDIAFSLVKSLKKESLSNKIIVDLTNPLDISANPPKYIGSIDNPLSVQIQNLIPEAKVVKAFNTAGIGIIVNPKRQDGKPTLFIAGNDKGAKEEVTKIAKSWGWEDVVDYGDVSKAFYIEALGVTWINYAFSNNSWTHAFSLLRK